MGNPASPTNAGGKQLAFLSDVAHAGTGYLPLGRGAVTMGTGLTPGAHATILPPASVAARTSVTADDADTLILAANERRVGATVMNESSATLYLALGTAAASATDYTVAVPASGYYEVPFGYAGQIRGIWAAVNGAARVTELAHA